MILIRACFIASLHVAFTGATHLAAPTTPAGEVPSGRWLGSNCNGFGKSKRRRIEALSGERRRSFEVWRHTSNDVAAFQLPSTRRTRKPRYSRMNYLLAQEERNTYETGNIGSNESLRQSIENLVSIIDPTKAKPDDENTVHIIGTGLCPTLLNLPLSTLKTLSQADAVLYDSLGLSYEDICQIVPRHCEVICVGKRGDQKSWKQSDIDELILKMALPPSALDTSQSDDIQQSTTTSTRGKTIVRLKGGDPFLFGRTRTEIDALQSNNIPYTYTPGISSCIAGPHLGGIPLTDPSLDCQSFAVWSGTDAFGRSWGLKKEDDGPNDDDDDDDDRSKKKWQGVDVDVLVFLMIGRLDKLEALCHSIAYGDDGVDHDIQKWNKDTPCAVIQNAGGIRDGGGDDDETNNKLPVQRVWRSTLENIVTVIKGEDEARTSVSPAVFVVGATAALNLMST